MAAPKKSVDDIWRELNAPRPRTTHLGSSTGVAGFGIPGVSTRTRVLPPKQAAGSSALGASTHAADVAVHQQAAAARAAAAAAAGYDPAAAGVSAEQLQAYLGSMQRTINCLTDPDRSTRKAAVAMLAAKLRAGDAATPKASPQMLQVGRVAECLWLSGWVQHARAAAAAAACK